MGVFEQINKRNSIKIINAKGIAQNGLKKSIFISLTFLTGIQK